MGQLLLVEDDELVGDALSGLLPQAGFVVNWVRDGTAAKLAIATGEYESVVLDLSLPDCSGLSVLTGMRAQSNATPVVVITARSGAADRVEALNRGADDVIVKPVAIEELVARLRAVRRRLRGRAEGVIRCGEVVLDPNTRSVTYRDTPREVSRREFEILRLFMERPGRVVSRRRLEEFLSDDSRAVSSNILEVYVHNLRKKLDSHVIHTVRGVGYMLECKP